MKWLSILEKDKTKVDDFITEYEGYLTEAKSELEIADNLIYEGRKLPYIVDLRYGQLQEIEAVFEIFDIHAKEVKSKYHRKYLTGYNQKLTSRDVERYVEGEPDYIDALLLRNKVNLLRNKFASITKGLEYKHFQLTNIVKLRAAGIDDF